MLTYRLIFPPPADFAIERAQTATFQTDKVLEVGDVIDHGGKRWRVSQAPVVDPNGGASADVMVWPAD